MKVDKPCILVVEDDPSVRAMIANALARVGTVIEAADGETALELIRVHAPHLVCLDLTLPEISGFGVCAELRKSPVGATTRVLVISDRTTLGDRVHAQEVGADDFLAKPFRARDLVERARKWAAAAMADRVRFDKAQAEERALQQQQQEAAKAVALNAAAQAAATANLAALQIATPLRVTAAPAQGFDNSINASEAISEVST